MGCGRTLIWFIGCGRTLNHYVYICPYFFILNSLSLSLFFCRLLYSFVNFFSISSCFSFIHIYYMIRPLCMIYSHIYISKNSIFFNYISNVKFVIVGSSLIAPSYLLFSRLLSSCLFLDLSLPRLFLFLNLAFKRCKTGLMPFFSRRLLPLLPR